MIYFKKSYVCVIAISILSYPGDTYYFFYILFVVNKNLSKLQMFIYLC